MAELTDKVTDKQGKSFWKENGSYVGYVLGGLSSAPNPYQMIGGIALRICQDAKVFTSVNAYKIINGIRVASAVVAGADLLGGVDLDWETFTDAAILVSSIADIKKYSSEKLPYR